MIQTISKTGSILQISITCNFEDAKLFFCFNSSQSITYQKVLPWLHFGGCSYSLDIGVTTKAKNDVWETCAQVEFLFLP